MVIISLINNLALLVALSVLSSFIGLRVGSRWKTSLFQGLLFGSAAVIGMLCPLKVSPGVIFDGRSVILSLCGLFFGPWAVLIAGSMAVVCRLWLGGAGLTMGLSTIVTSTVLGVLAFRRQRRLKRDVSLEFLWGFGLFVHVVLCLCMFTLPYDSALFSLKRVAPLILLLYPLATVLMGKILLDQRERTQYLAALQNSEQRFRSLANSGPGLMWACGADQKGMFVNQAYLSYTGRTFSQSAGDGWQECVHPDDLTPYVALRKKSMDARERFEFVYRLRRHDGEYRWFLNSASPNYDAAENFLGYIGHCLDITDNRKVEESLRRIEWMLSKKPQKREPSLLGGFDGRCALAALNTQGTIIRSVGRDRLDSIVSESLELLGTYAVVFEADGSYAFCLFESEWCRLLDRASCRLCGLPDKEKAAASGQWLCHEACWTACAKPLMADRNREEADVECLGGIHLYSVPIRVGGEAVGAIAFGYGDPPRDPKRLAALSEICRISIGELEAASAAYDSRPPYIIEMAKRRLRAAASLIGSLVETRQLEDARAQMEDYFRQAQKMEAIGRLAGGVAHEFNNILQTVRGYGEMLLERLPPAGQMHDFAEEIVAGSRRAETLTRQLLMLSRKEASDLKTVDLNEVVAAALQSLRQLLDEDDELIWKPTDARVPVRIGDGQLNQILINLIVNARDAIRDEDVRGRIVVETGHEMFDALRCLQYPDCVPGNYAVLTVSDNGCGMDQKTVSHLFEPFYSSKEHDRGTGLNVAAVFGLVKQNRGHVEVQSSPGDGTVFKLYFPEQKTMEAPAEEEALSATPSEHSAAEKRTVLVVDDEEALLRTSRRMLEDLEYTVLTATGPEEALRLAKGYSEKIDLLLTDVVMPGMSGRELWKKIEVLRPEMKCIYMSGFTANIIAQKSASEKGVNFLQKPFSKVMLAAKLADVLPPGRG